MTGASGLLGKNLIRQILAESHEVVALVRRPADLIFLPEQNVFSWEQLKDEAEKIFARVDAIVHLAGENIADKRWSKNRKEALVRSRIESTSALVKALETLSADKRPHTLICGSAIGYYGYQRDQLLTEQDSAGADFLAQLCQDWEKEAKKAEVLGLRVILARTGIVLTRVGGALPQMPPIQISNGQSYLSWIHIVDWVRAVIFLLQQKQIAGAVNLVAPNPINNKTFVKTQARILGLPAFGFVPKIFLKIGLGELSSAILSSLRVRPAVLDSFGFQFRFPDHVSALEQELKGKSILDQSFFRDQFVAKTAQEVFPFFSKAENLETLTPPWLNFRILQKSTTEVQKGTLIDYRLKIHGVPVRWRTLISQWNPDKSFVDEQLRGPYSRWHHLHTFTPVTGGTLLGDEVTYRVPGWIFGKILLSKWIRADVTQIFSYRQKRIRELESTNSLG